MHSRFLLVLLLMPLACADRKPAAQSPDTPATATAAGAAAAPAAARLTISRTGWLKSDQPFEWRGITAFRLAEQMAHGREAEAIAYLDWAQRQQLTVVRVLAMAKHLFELKPDEGLKALPRLLSLAADRDLVVEVVALADTGAVPIDPEQHVKAVAAIAATHPNAVVEIANEPFHPTQDARLHDPAFVRSLAGLVPASIPVALGSGSGDGEDGYAAAGTYATWHPPRGNDADGWEHVLTLATGAALVAKWQKPVISDEPIGAADVHLPGRRDNEPARFAAAAAVTRLAGLGATFHYEGGLQARVPSGRELECFNAWKSALLALDALPPGGRFVSGRELEELGSVTGARAVFGRQYDIEAWVAAIDAPDAAMQWKPSWQERSRSSLPGVKLIQVSRTR